jgi:DNA-directed RNA polymerase omega subunit
MEIPEKIDSKFRYVLLSARRAEQMVRGARPKMDHLSRKPTRRAMAEIDADAVNWDYGPEPQPEAPPQES